jgi:archaellum biogenesis ATPase FlaH
MLKHEIQSKLSSMAKRKLLFILGEHQTGKTEGVQAFLKDRYKENWNKYYVDIGLYLQKRINQEQIETYDIFPDEFVDDSISFINEIIMSKREELLVFDHCEWLFSEEQTEWLKLLIREAEEKRTIIIIVPTEYRGLIPAHAYSVIEWGGGQL